ncbi:MAG: ATP-binding protein [Actinomycetota bacterium]
MDAGARAGRRVARLPLALKLLTPFLVLMLVAGALGAFLIVRDLSASAEASLERELARRSLAAESLFQDRELYLLESASFAANVEGMAPAVRVEDAPRIRELLRSVLALKTDLTWVGVVDASRGSVVGFLRQRPGGPPAVARLGSWTGGAIVQRAVNDEDGGRHAGFVRLGRRWSYAVASPICTGGSTCRAVGAAFAAIRVDVLVAEAVDRLTSGVAQPSSAGLAVFGPNRRLLGAIGPVPERLPAEAGGDGPVRTTQLLDGQHSATLFSSLRLVRPSGGTLAVSIPTATAFSAARQAGIRLATLMLLAMAGVMTIGALLVRAMLRQVRSLVETNRQLGEGDLSARAPILSGDELGELAAGVNEMAEQLEASYETLEMRVAERTEEVRRLLRERTEFFAAMSHEFRTPLAVIMGNVDMLLDPEYRRERENVADAGRTIKESAAQLLAVVNDILSLARAETGQLELVLQDTDLGEVMGDVRRTVKGLTQAAGLRARIEVPDGLMVRADPLRLREILLNLVDNAVKYTPPGGTVTVSAVSKRDVAAVTVADTGVGIPADALERIFEPFFRVKGTTAQRGQASSGLGLALTKRLVEAQGGDIRVESVPGKGTTFTFTLSAVRGGRGDQPPGGALDIGPVFSGNTSS